MTQPQDPHGAQPPAAPPQWQPPQYPRSESLPPVFPPGYAGRPDAQGYYPSPVRYVPQQVAPRSVIGAVAFSFVIPGAGTIYAGGKGWGIAILVLWIVSIPLFLVGIGFWTGLVCWIAGMISAGTAAQKWNRDHGIVS